VPIASGVTSYGRLMIEETTRIVTEHYTKANGFPGDAQVIYGDSVVGSTPILVQRNGITEWTCIGKLEGDFKPYGVPVKMAFVPAQPLLVWSDKGFTAVKRVIKHIVNKPLVEVSTDTGIVTVTSEHSLLRKADASCISPTECVVGSTELLHANLPNLQSAAAPFGITTSTAYLWGVFFNHGHLDATTVPQWGVWSYDSKMLKELAEMFKKEEFGQQDFSVSTKFEMDSDVKDLRVRDGSSMYNRYVRIFKCGPGHDPELHVPDLILNGSLDVQRSFVKGFFDIQRDVVGTRSCGHRGTVGMAALYHLLNMVGHDVLINPATRTSFLQLVERGHHTKDTVNVLNYETPRVLMSGCTVYDLETENHHFAAGIGRLVVHNTDSVMVKFGVPDVPTAMKMGKEAAALVTKHFPPPISLEFEKVYFPYLLISKKRYAGLLWMNPEKWMKLDTKGLESVRRDNCPLVKTLQGACIEKILVSRDVKGAMELAKLRISELLQNKLDMSQLIISKGLSKEGSAYKSKQPHVELAERLRQRDAATAPNMGDRVPYVITTAIKGSKLYEQAEDPLYALENDIPLSFPYYMDNQLKLPLCRVFKAVVKDPVKELFTGPHTMKRVLTTPSFKVGGIMRFVKHAVQCTKCKCVTVSAKHKDRNDCQRKDDGLVPDIENPLCTQCQPAWFDVRSTAAETAWQADLKRYMAVDFCKTCTKSASDIIVCQNRDCEHFYMRAKATIDFEKARKTYDGFVNYESHTGKTPVPNCTAEISLLDNDNPEML
jgi:hypothetical protein